MVRTSKGPAEKSQPKKATPKMTSEDEEVQDVNEIDAETMERIVELAKSQQTTVTDVVQRAITQMFGDSQPTGAYHSGEASDPTV